MDGTISEQPVETAPMLGVWRTLSPTVAKIIRCQPSLASRLSLAPQAAIHSIAAFLHHHVFDDVDIDLIAHEIFTREARDLLALAVPNVHARLYGLLPRIGSGTKSLIFYRDLNTEISQGAADVIFDAPSISLRTIRIARQIRADPVLLAARKAIGEDESRLRHLMSVLAMLRSLGLANHVERMPRGAGIQATVRRIKADLRAGKPPPVSFAVPAGWEQVKDVGQLVRIGELLQNCLAVYAADGTRHINSFLTGSCAYFVHNGSPTMLVSFSKLGPRTWSVGDFGSSGSVESEDEERDTMIIDFQASMAQSGDVLIGVDPFSALLELSYRARG
jgi:hypothetical protein